MAALGAASQRLTTHEMLAIALVSDSEGTLNATASVIAMEYEQVRNDTLLMDRRVFSSHCDSTAPLVWAEDNMIRYRVPKAQHINLQMVDPSTGESQVIVDSFRTAGSYTVPMIGERDALRKYVWQFSGDSSTVMMQLRDDLSGGAPPLLENDSTRVRMVMSVLDGLESAELKPIVQRIDQGELDSILSLSLDEAGIDLEHTYGVLTATDSLPIEQPIGYAEQLRSSPFRARLFPHDLFSQPADLVVYFPERTAYLYQQMFPMVLPTALFMLVVVGCFAYTIRTILTQRRFATLLMEFINNMTHEFKTPIATVRLACEAIARDDVIADENRVRRFNDMILGETRRMKNQTDKILQMAVLEEGDYELKTEAVDVHRLITGAVEAVALHVEHCRGTIEAELEASRHTMTADPVHLANVIHNLLDNAAKYSPEHPKIRVTTTNDNGALTLAVSDNGVGMHADDCRRAFDKYFRVSHGNVHDVKGFGLGLSYVKLMVKAHGGTVTLHSRPGEGTRVEVTFPESTLVE
jgi:signal transduction histidine kinase